MLTVHHLNKSFDFQKLFEDITFSLNAGERIGLIGPNGCGKTTLLRILAGEEQADAGHVRRDPDLRIGYLPQGLVIPAERTLGEVIGQATDSATALEDALVAAAAALVQQPGDRQAQARYDDLLRRIQSGANSNPAATLAALGLASIPAGMPVGQLSGGQQTRLALALTLLGDPQLLLLDEPTNHLDIAMLEWLEDWLSACPCAALIVSHDRAFLDRSVTRILEMNPHTRRSREYAGNYTAYQAQRQAEIEKQWAAYQDQQAEIHRMHQDVVRLKAQAAYTEHQTSSARIGGGNMKLAGVKDHQRTIAKKVARKAASRQKKLDRYLESDERVEKPQREWQMKLAFGEAAHHSRWAIRLEQLAVGYRADLPLLHGLSLEVRPGQRVVLTGPNGSGKTTLLRTIGGQLLPLAGEVRLGASTRLGYMTQDQSSLDMNSTAAETMQPYFATETEARTFLSYFLFTGDEPLKPNALLSYGQRARLMLALLVAGGCTCLLLDEPVNHLDIPSRAQFEQALASFDGAVLAVVHDRYFIQRFADEVWWVENGGIMVIDVKLD